MGVQLFHYLLIDEIWTSPSNALYLQQAYKVTTRICVHTLRSKCPDLVDPNESLREEGTIEGPY